MFVHMSQKSKVYLSPAPPLTRYSGGAMLAMPERAKVFVLNLVLLKVLQSSRDECIDFSPKLARDASGQ
jgi:hypothetical protein